MIYSLEYTDYLLENKAGVTEYCFWPHIKIRNEYKADEGILQHELEHARQYWSGGMFIHSIRYKHCESYRLECEVKAYKIQDKYYMVNKLDYFADRICNDYGLDVDKDEVLQMLREL